jgi:hypothetical protein
MEALIMLIIFSPALAFFGGRTFLKYQEIKHRSGGGSLDENTTKRLEALEAENADLKERVETLETIATTSVGLEGAAKLKELEAEVRTRK